MLTLAKIEEVYGVDYLDYLDRDAEIPSISGIGFQGDVAIIKTTGAAKTPLPANGFPVVRGESGGNTHLLIGKGYFDPSSTTSATELSLGLLTVPENEEVLLSHPEHGAMIITTGTYDMRRQREQADILRIVAD